MANFGFTYTLPTITGSHTDLPVVLKTADFPTSAVDASGDAIDNGGGNLRAYTDDGKGTQLSLDVVKFVTGVSPSCVVWVKVPTAATGNTVYLEADGLAVTQPAVGAAFGRNAVWSDYEAVLHLRESGNGTVGEFVDSTGNGHDGQLIVGSSISTVTTDHPFGDEWPDFNTLKGIELANSAALVNGSAYTLSAICNLDVSSSSNGLFGNWVTAAIPDMTEMNTNGRFFSWDTNGAQLAASPTDRPVLVTSLAHAVADASGITSYDNGVSIATDSGNATLLNCPDDLMVGTYNNLGSSRGADGRICEARVRRSALSSDWVVVEEDNQLATVAWGTVGMWAEQGGGGRALGSIDGDDDVQAGQTSVSITAVGLVLPIVSVTLGGETLTVTGTPTVSNIDVDIPLHVNLKWGGTTNQLEVTDTTGPLTLDNVTLSAPTGWETVTFNGVVPDAPTTESLHEEAVTDLSFTGVINDIYAWETQTGLSHDVQTLPTVSPPTTVTFDYKVWDDSLATWTAVSSGTWADGGSSVNVDIPVGAMTLSGLAPLVLIGDDLTVDIPTANMAFVGQSPEVVVVAGVLIDIPTGSLTLNTFAPFVDLGDLSLTIPSGVMTITGLIPRVLTVLSEDLNFSVSGVINTDPVLVKGKINTSPVNTVGRIDGS